MGAGGCPAAGWVEKILSFEPVFDLRPEVDVQERKFAEQFGGNPVVCNRSVKLIEKMSYVNYPAVKTDIGAPSLVVSAPANSFVSGRAACLGQAVLRILSVSADAQIAPAIVEPVVIFVVAEQAICRL